MEFKTIISKQANFYFFVQNLSEWHFSNRKQYNIFWEKELGGFSEGERGAIKLFKEVHLKYPFENSYLGRYFFTEKNSWDVLSKELPKKDFEEIRNIFSLLEEKFEALYKRNLPLLKKWQDILNKGLNNENIGTINDTLSKLYNTEPLDKDIDIFLLFSTGKNSGNGSTTNNKSINVEISQCPFDQKNHITGIIWHELTHLYFEKGHFLDLLNQEFCSDKEKIRLAREITNCSLFPNGVLGKLLLGISQSSLNARVPIKDKDKLLELTEEYVRERKSFDEKYVGKIYDFLDMKI